VHPKEIFSYLKELEEMQDIGEIHKKIKELIKSMEHMTIQEKLNKLREMVERGESTDPLMFKLDITNYNESEEAMELYRILEEKMKTVPEYKSCFKELQNSLLRYLEKRDAKKIREYFEHIGQPIPPMLRSYVEVDE